MEIALIIIASCCLVAIVIFGIILIRKKPDSSVPATIDLKEIGAISKQIEMLEKQIDKDIKQAVSDEIIKIGDKNAKDNEQANQKLERFQSNITDSLNKRLKPQISNKKKPGLSNSNANKNLMELNSGEEDMDNIDNIIIPIIIIFYIAKITFF